MGELSRWRMYARSTDIILLSCSIFFESIQRFKAHCLSTTVKRKNEFHFRRWSHFKRERWNDLFNYVIKTNVIDVGTRADCDTRSWNLMLTQPKRMRLIIGLTWDRIHIGRRFTSRTWVYSSPVSVDQHRMRGCLSNLSNYTALQWATGLHNMHCSEAPIIRFHSSVSCQDIPSIIFFPALAHVTQINYSLVFHFPVYINTNLDLHRSSTFTSGTHFLVLQSLCGVGSMNVSANQTVNGLRRR